MSPIRPENRHKYPGGSPTSKEWKAIRASIQERAGDNCEWCGVPNRKRVVRGKTDSVFWVERNHLERRFHRQGAVVSIPLERLEKAPHLKLVRIICTVAHLDHDPRNNEPGNLAFLCQRCHNRYDSKHRAETRKKKKGN